MQEMREMRERGVREEVRVGVKKGGTWNEVEFENGVSNAEGWQKVSTRNKKQMHYRGNRLGGLILLEYRAEGMVQYRSFSQNFLITLGPKKCCPFFKNSKGPSRWLSQPEEIKEGNDLVLSVFSKCLTLSFLL